MAVAALRRQVAIVDQELSARRDGMMQNLAMVAAERFSESTLGDTLVDKSLGFIERVLDELVRGCHAHDRRSGEREGRGNGPDI